MKVVKLVPREQFLFTCSDTHLLTYLLTYLSHNAQHYGQTTV